MYLFCSLYHTNLTDVHSDKHKNQTANLGNWKVKNDDKTFDSVAANVQKASRSTTAITQGITVKNSCC
jgi:hypothetical protein